MLNQFKNLSCKNLSCYEEFEIQCALMGISKVDILSVIGRKIDNYYFFILKDGIFNWFDLNGNHVEDPGILKELKENHIPTTITKCVIPDSVISICTDTFLGCASLKEIIIPNSVASIGNYAFHYCESLKEITIPDSVTSIGCEAFSGCKSLISITIPDSVKSIGKYAFYYCKSLKEIIFKGKTLDEVKRMENYPFGKYENIFKFS